MKEHAPAVALRVTNTEDALQAQEGITPVHEFLRGWRSVKS